MTDTIKNRIPPTFFKDIFLDLEDCCRAGAIKAFEMVRDHANLDSKRARELEGQARFRMMEKGFQEVCELHGGQLIPNGIIPSTDLKIFQPFMRFVIDGQGVILGLAMMPEPHALPTKNKSRKAGVMLNYHLQPTLDLDTDGPKTGDIFALFLASRDRQKAGRLEEIAIGIINSTYDQFLFYQPLDKYLKGHADSPLPVPFPPESGASQLRLKTHTRPFVPPEAPGQEEGEAERNN